MPAHKPGGIAQKAEVHGGVRRVGTGLIGLHLLRGGGEGAVKTIKKGAVAILHGAVILQLGADEQVHVPNGHHLLENADKREIGQMLPVVFLALGPGEQGIFGVIIYHGGGEGVILIQPDGLPLIAFPKRADARDALVLPEDGSWDREKPIGCSSARRRVQLAQLFPGIEVKPVRGNVQTRLRRLDSGEYGALVLAAAGLHRLGLENRISRYFSPEEMLPAAGQGILAVQAREGECRAAAQLLDDAETRVCALAERAFIRALGGGCFSPAAAYAVLENGMLRLRGLYVSADERSLIRGELTGAPETGERLGCMLAERLRRQAEEET